MKNPIIKMSVNGKELENDKFLYYSDDNDINFNLNVNIKFSALKLFIVTGLKPVAVSLTAF